MVRCDVVLVGEKKHASYVTAWKRTTERASLENVKKTERGGWIEGKCHERSCSKHHFLLRFGIGLCKEEK